MLMPFLEGLVWFYLYFDFCLYNYLYVCSKFDDNDHDSITARLEISILSLRREMCYSVCDYMYRTMKLNDCHLFLIHTRLAKCIRFYYCILLQNFSE